MKKLQRNNACWCGSGKKYKKCHLKEDEMTTKQEKMGGSQTTQVRITLANNLVNQGQLVEALDSFNQLLTEKQNLYWEADTLDLEPGK